MAKRTGMNGAGEDAHGKNAGAVNEGRGGAGCADVLLACPSPQPGAGRRPVSLLQDFRCHFQGCLLLGSVLRSRLEPVLLVGLDWGQHRAHSCPSIAGLQLNQKALTTFPDVVLVRVPTPSVQSDSDITVLRHLEKLGCRLVNRPQSILNCVNKFWTFQELAGHGVPMPDTFSYGGHEDFSKMIDEAEPLGYPVVVKSTRGHRGKAVFLARDKHHLSDICHLIRHDVPYLFQKYVKESHGKDIRVVVVGGRVIGSMLRCSTDGRMQSNCSLGGVGVMCPLTEQGKQLAIQVSNILGMDFCGIDLLIMDDGSFVVCEANANVGFLAFDQACNLDVGGIIADYTMSLLPNRQTGKMAVLPGLSSPREKKEPDGCASAQGVAESVYAINNGSTSSESEPELGEIRDSSVSTMGGPPPMLPEPGYNINNRIASELKLK
ncbi:N-acetylaspartylglutamate synthase A [Ursus maritimus]|uniref:N-acetylaspartylglutamate synthase n=1 Tax=Ursus maritimus TaxID=29073 RepID=A0A384CT62_URSMA|nr:N-acetylaspartylglutamate synthase A [Ursus maritimus]